MPKDWFLLLRPHQWAKNVFVFLPLFFGGQFFSTMLFLGSVRAFLAYSLAASAVYCLNDILDRGADRLHPVKCRRPVASGRISVPVAGAMAGVLAVAASAVASWPFGERGYELLAIVWAYLLLNVAYCLRLKRVPLVDVFVIATGFVLRLLAGSAATGIVLSCWIVVMTFLLALFLALAKRRDDVVLYNATGVLPRRGIDRYNLEFMNQSISILAAVLVVAYLMYTVSPEVTTRIGSPYLYATMAFVLLGLLRYLQLTIVDVRSGSPTKVLLRDRFTQACLVCWLLSFFVILYL